ncbi:MAG: hypothetical protein L0332_29015 [Chloroflexi bacterium]|nr:hypothetical protein [Chloroflexota bacterium]MCI0578244.1 hypothetical protein [Chloroflexota bacterium]MCI0648634.1 hypothetical protein [Chloroflexota bacterium]MCI0730741.1 hypothetical protein [Chloroflexota bacterium]
MFNKTAQHVAMEQNAIGRELAALEARQQALEAEAMRLNLLEQVQRQGVAVSQPEPWHVQWTNGR